MYKSPDYVFLSTVSNAALLSVALLFVPGSAKPTDTPSGGPQRMAIAGGLVTAAAAIGLSLWQSHVESHENLENEVAYSQILTEMDQLRQNGTLARDAIVLSSSHGIPWHWSNPLWIRFPNFTYLDTGWNTFSPYYNEAVMAHDLQPLIDSIRASDRVYLTSKPIFQGFLAQYIEEHEGKVVEFVTLYRLPNSPQVGGERGIELYKVVPAHQLVP